MISQYTLFAILSANDSSTIIDLPRYYSYSKRLAYAGAIIETYDILTDKNDLINCGFNTRRGGDGCGSDIYFQSPFESAVKLAGGST